MQSRKKFVDGKGCCKHIDTDDGGPVGSHAGDITVADLLRVRSRVIGNRVTDGYDFWVCSATLYNGAQLFESRDR